MDHLKVQARGDKGYFKKSSFLRFGNSDRVQGIGTRLVMQEGEALLEKQRQKGQACRGVG